MTLATHPTVRMRSKKQLPPNPILVSGEVVLLLLLLLQAQALLPLMSQRLRLQLLGRGGESCEIFLLLARQPIIISPLIIVKLRLRSRPRKLLHLKKVCISGWIRTDIFVILERATYLVLRMNVDPCNPLSEFWSCPWYVNKFVSVLTWCKKYIWHIIKCHNIFKWFLFRDFDELFLLSYRVWLCSIFILFFFVIASVANTRSTRSGGGGKSTPIPPANNPSPKTTRRTRK